MPYKKAKEVASQKALEFVRNGMIIGLGTGSTATFFIQHLIEKCQKGLKIQAVATSIESEMMAKEGGIPILDINTVTTLDLTVDGADEVDPQKRLIKGAGGALTREKIIATMSKEMIVIVDNSKLVDKLGRGPIPLEIIPFGVESIKKKIEEEGYQGVWRKNKEGSFYMTDNHNRIFDIKLPTPLDRPEKMDEKLKAIPGVVETGFFFNLAKRIIVGKEDGSADVYN